MAQQDAAQLLDLLADLKPLAAANPNSSISSLYDWLIGQIETLIDNATKTVWGVVSSIETGIKDRIDTVRDGLQSTITTVETRIRDRLTGVTQSVSAVIRSTEAEIKDFMAGALTGIGDRLAAVINNISSSINGVIDAIRSIAGEIGQTIANALGSVVSSLRTEIIRVVGTIRDSIRDMISGLADGLADFGAAIYSGIQDAIRDVRNWLDGILNTIKTAITDVYHTVRDVITDVYDRIREGIESAYHASRDFVATLADRLRSGIQEGIEFLRSLLVSLIQYLQEHIIPDIVNLRADILKLLMASSDWSREFLNLSQADVDRLLAGDLSVLKRVMTSAGKGIGDLIEHTPLYSLFYALSYIHNQIALTFIPAQVAASTQAQIDLGLAPPPFDLMRRAYLMGQVERQDVIEGMRLAGIAPANAEKALQGLRELPPAGWIQEAYLRGEISEDQHDFYLRSHGFSDEDIGIFKLLYFRLPPVADLIRMAVRDVFTPEIRERFGQDEDYPLDFDRLAVKIGLDKEWAKAYWAAHWDLPSPMMGYEMLHRGIIDEDTLNLLLRALDIMPFWRDKLIQISYNPLTRVDVRRMYQLGVLTEDEVYRSYLDIGYNPTNARRLTEFTKRYSAPEDESELSEFRRLARSTYSAAYKRRVISRDEYLKMLSDMGYVPDDAELLATLDDTAMAAASDLFDEDDFNREYKSLLIKGYKSGVLNADDLRVILADLGYSELEIALQVQVLDTEYSMYIKSLVADKISELYTGYTIDETQVHEYLNVFGFSASEIDRYMREWTIHRNLRTRKPSQSDLVRFYRDGMLNLEQLTNELRGLGYNERYIPMYIQLYKD
ncbi:MAG: hypothetical protein ROW48_18315 [Bellilinea sp.]|jgi:ABC-type transporter Mla subunit MlaD